MRIEIEVNNKVYERLDNLAEVAEQTVEEYCLERIGNERLNTKTHEEFEKTLRIHKNTFERNRERAILSKHPMQRWILKTYKNKNHIEILWRTNKICATEENRRAWGADKIGQYWYIVRWCKPSGIVKGLSQVYKEQRHTYRTLKALKKAVNRECIKYGYGPHYKVHKKAGG
jgi:hypothetical protein